MKTFKFDLLVLTLLIQSIKSENLSLGSSCQARDISEGTCIAINNCNSIEEKLKKGLVKPVDVVCNQFLRYVCCPSESTAINSRSSIWDLIEDGPSTCGKQVKAFGTAFHGTQVERGQYPWNVALTKSSDGKHFCGGSLVSKKLVVTAAHCIEGKGRQYFFRPRDIFVIIGAHDLEARREPGRITASVEAIYVHHDWNPHVASYDADIAIIELEDEVTFNRYIQPICLAVPKSEAASKTDGIVAGFGKSEHRESENIARVISSPIHSYDVCANSSDHESLLTRRTFCGGYENGTSVCRGDSGSGLMVRHNGIYYLRGIVSSSLYDPYIGCNINTYSIFTDVLNFYGWITTGKDEQILLRELQDEIRRLRMQSTTTEKIIPTTIDPNFAKKIVSKSLNDRANAFEFPHHAFLGYHIETPHSRLRTDKIFWRCSGSLISHNFIVTGTNCLINMQYSGPKLVKLGMTNLAQNDDDVHYYGVQEKFLHPGYQFWKSFNNIGLVKLNESVKFSEFICSASLPIRQLEVATAVVSGFVMNNKMEHEVGEYLQKNELQKYSIGDCEQYYQGYDVDSKNRICYGKPLENTVKCGINSGSPLQVLNDDQSMCPYTLIGIYNTGFRDCTKGPSYYINVYDYVSWIKEKVGGDDELNKNICSIWIK